MKLFLCFTTKQWSKIKPRLTFNEHKKVISVVGHQLTQRKCHALTVIKIGWWLDLLVALALVVMSIEGFVVDSHRERKKIRTSFSE